MKRGNIVGELSESGASAASRAESVLHFWFEPEPNAEDDTFRLRWFVPTPEFDMLCAARFLNTCEDAALGRLEDWRIEPRTCLALVLLLDQLPRNIFRGSPRAFATDSKAREICRHAIASGFDRELSPLKRMFLYLPLQHSENLDDQLESVRLSRELTEEMMKESPHHSEVMEIAEQHLEVIRRFGRFPGRNDALGRRSTPEEIDYLKEQKR